MPSKIKYPKTPELDKMKAVKDQSQIIGEFIDSVSERGLVLAEYDAKDRLWPTQKGIEKILAEHFKIDLAKVENERRAILAHIRDEK